jgi:DNA-directed RNA polymerase specialized sigma24 family protein
LAGKVEEGFVSKSDLLAQELPKLRRYARALTGSQVSGDAYVGSALEALAEEPTLIDSAGSPRAALYKMFSTIWNSIDINTQPNFGETTDGPERHLTRITPLPRQAFLLLTLEDFSEGDAAEILGVEVEELRRLADEAGREMAAEIATDILIIEDEPMISMELESLVESLGHTVAGVARTHRESIALAKARRPGMILADIRLADASSGLDAVNELLGLFEVPVIFITAYPEQFLTGSRPEPTFLIPKPFQPATVSAVISQVLFFEQKAKAHPASGPRFASEPAGKR